MTHHFETVDVFTDRRFGGNPLAVFPDAQGLTAEEMQSLSAELNLSETVFVLPPADPANTARMRIFNRTAEMPFAGHPSIGTAYILARHGNAETEMRFEVPAGLVRVTVTRNAEGEPTGGRLIAPRPLATRETVAPEAIAACLGLTPADIRTAAHAPLAMSVGVEFFAVEVAPDALARCVPDIAAFRAALQPWMDGRLSLFTYTRSGEKIRARMFAPLAGTIEDAATGSASAALGALLLSLDGSDRAAFAVTQGVEMGRPSLLQVEAERTGEGIIASVGGNCVPMFEGKISR